MKKVNLFILFIIIFGFGFTDSANAQFLNRLKNKVLEKTEEVIIDKAADKAAEKTSNAMEKIHNPNLEGLFNFGGKSVDLADLPEVYRFDYDYTVKMATEGGETNMNYLFSKNDSYIGIKTEISPDMIMILDNSKNVFIIKSNETVIARELTTDQELSEEDLDIKYDYTFSELPDREYLGYNCKGFKLESDEHNIIVYFAPEINVRFGDTRGQGIANMPKEMIAFTKKYENGLMMFMEMEDNSKKGNNMTMECIAFNESSTNIRLK